MKKFIILLIALALVACSKKEARVEISENQSPAEFLKFGNQFYQDGDYENAFRAYGFVYYNHPTSPEYIDAAIGLSRCYGALEDYEKAFGILHDLLKNNLIPSKVPDIYVAIAEFYERSAGISEQISGKTETDLQKAIEYYQKAIEYPNSENIAAKGYAQYKIGQLYERMSQFDKALQSYQAASAQFSGSEWALRAEERYAALNQRIERRNNLLENGLLPDTTTTKKQ